MAAEGRSTGETTSESGARTLGKKSTIRLRASDKVTLRTVRETMMKNGDIITESLRRRTEIMEENNAILAFKRDDCSTQEDLVGSAELFRMIRKYHINRLRERMCEGGDSGTATPRVGNSGDKSSSEIEA